MLASDDSRVTMYVPGQGVRPFTFEHVITPGGTQLDLYERTARTSIIAALNGFNACLFVYGQTGSGKTHTIFGPDGTLKRVQTRTHTLPAEAGVALRALQEIMTAVRSDEIGGVRSTVRASLTAQYVQIYNEGLTDLLSGDVVQLRGGPDGFVLQGCVETQLDTFQDAVNLLQIGEANKHYAATTMNNHSSRAHTILVLNIKQVRGGNLVKSHLHLVDLAGCEQLKQSKATGSRMKVAIGINVSLMALKRVIKALVEDHNHVPYYDSKLTMLLKSALGGASRTTAIITGAMDDRFAAQTLQALRFGESVAQVVNSASFSGLSVQSALDQLHKSLSTCKHTLASLETRGKTHIDAYKKAKQMSSTLGRKIAELERMQPS